MTLISSTETFSLHWKTEAKSKERFHISVKVNTGIYCGTTSKRKSKVFLPLPVPFGYYIWGRSRNGVDGVIRGGVRRGTHTAYHQTFSCNLLQNHRKVNKPKGRRKKKTNASGKNDLMFSPVAWHNNTQDTTKSMLILWLKVHFGKRGGKKK